MKIESKVCILTALLFLLSFPLFTFATNRVIEIEKDSIISDFDALVKIIEDTHPDPYTNYGGKVFFHKTANSMRRALETADCLTLQDLYDKSSEFISFLQDGHSYINPPAVRNVSSGSDSIVLIKFMYGGGALIVNAVEKKGAHLIGSRLIGINGIPVEVIADRVAKYYPCENTAGKFGFLSDYFRTVAIYRKLTENSDGTLSFQLKTPEGDTVSYLPSVIPGNAFSGTELARTPQTKEFPSGQLEWRVVDGSMIFRLSTVLSRENFAYQYANGWDFYGDLKNYYRMSGSEMPSDTLAAINGVPSMSETFMDMLSEMKTQGVRNLVIDLRGNGGGWTPITLPTLYMMYGDRYLDTDMSSHFFRRVSDLYLEKINTTIEEFNRRNGTLLKTGDYLIPEEMEDCRSIEDKREGFINSAFCSDEIKTKLRSLNGIPLYQPENVCVVTDNGTFSAAFHYAFYLSRLGAVVAGETSSQAPNCYMETTPFTLPLTGLSGSVSNSMQVFLPGNDSRSKEFTPDIRLNYDEYRDCGFDRNSVLMKLVSLLKKDS